ncbi:DUF6188 family protein [Antrihabitans stalactiti]|uniref:DUF6188 family protein n=1 Tax=Antrihabitans stalactiti TaxID=2584121 RepID=UPI003B849BB6
MQPFAPRSAGSTTTNFGIARGQSTNLSATTSEDGTLEIEFGNDVRLVVRPDNSYKAWTLAGPSGIIAVCTPGGGLTTWSSRSIAD